MPMYEYHCATCGKTFTRIRHVDRHREQARCPVCKANCRPGLAPAALRFFGDGWTEKGGKQ